MQQQVDRLQISAEGVVALPQSLVSQLDLRPGDELVVRAEGAKIVLHRVNERRAMRNAPRPLGLGKGDFYLPEGWERPMSDADAEDFLNGL